LAIKFAV